MPAIWARSRAYEKPKREACARPPHPQPGPGALKQFEAKLQALVAELDALLPIGQDPNADQLAAIVDLCAGAHAEWIRNHPFANGNGRTARLWANWLAVRYRLPPFIRLRPRPDSVYGNAGSKAMQGDWKTTAVVFHQLLDDFLDGY
jgi:Fic/DOC family